MAMSTYARNRMVAWKVAAKNTGLTYDEVKAAYKTPKEEYENLSDLEKKAVGIAHSVLANYAKAYKEAQATAEAVAVEE